MSELQAELRAAFENNGYDVGSVSENRGQIRVTLLEDTAEAATLREITYGVVDEDDVLTMNVTTESVDGHEGMQTVVSFRHRPS